MHETIHEGDEVFLADGDVAFGAVRIAPDINADHLTIYIENAGEFRVPMRAVKDTHEGKVILNRALVQQDVLQAIRHAHDGEHSDI